MTSTPRKPPVLLGRSRSAQEHMTLRFRRPWKVVPGFDYAGENAFF